MPDAPVRRRPAASTQAARDAAIEAKRRRREEREAIVAAGPTPAALALRVQSTELEQHRDVWRYEDFYPHPLAHRVGTLLLDYFRNRSGCCVYGGWFVKGSWVSGN